MPYGQTADVRITYDLPDGGPRSESLIRVGRAYVSFYVFAHGDDQATVRIEVPPSFDVETRGGEIETAFDCRRPDDPDHGRLGRRPALVRLRRR